MDDTKAESIAMDILYAGKLNCTDHNIEYRKGKSIADVKKAREKALRVGRGKSEYELAMFAVYLKGIFKIRKPAKKVVAS